MRGRELGRLLAIAAFCGTGAACTVNNTTEAGGNPKDAGSDADVSVATDTSGSDTLAPDTLTPIPKKVDCSKQENCYHLACWDDPACSAVGDPGGCKQGQVKDIKAGVCRDCTADDCDGASSFCCGTAACSGSVACQLYICNDIAASCAGVTAATCGYHDLDSDDAWGDCDEAPSDPCCWCKIAVGCGDSKCKYGEYVDKGECKPCSATSCDRLSCMGLNGCATNCPAGAYFDGVACHDCYSSSSEDVIPACKLPDGGVYTDPPDSGVDAGLDDAPAEGG